MSVVLITGGNKGLGYEAARRLLGLGHKVYIGARDSSRGQTAARSLGAHFLSLDVSDEASVKAAAATLQQTERCLDVLINNAGIAGGMQTPDAITIDAFIKTFDTNVFGIVRTTLAFLPLLHKSRTPTIVNVSSGLGSFATVLDPNRIESTVVSGHYNASKAAVNMLTVQYAKALPSMRINAVDPGYTATDLNGHSGPQTVTEGTDAIVSMACAGKDGPTGTFSDRFGVRPW
jgi:NAD(P)-dependent dehydrogenase (short-subunit alcohol dehydrogenase family)